MTMKIERHHWRHYFGGVAVVLLVLQVLTGVFLTLYYSPDLQQAYSSVRELYRNFTFGAWIRDSHRWLAVFIFAVTVVHVTRSLLRKEFMNYARRTSWLTGALLLLPILALLVTGYILPWEWKAYWFMEMVPNYFGQLPIIGPALKSFTLEAFTLNRNFVAHVVILPVIAYILIEYHILALLRKRKAGISAYFTKHAIISIPFLIIVAFLAYYVQMPTLDPEIIPMPLEGANIPAPEWYFLFLLRPFLNFDGISASFLTIYLPLILLVTFIALPHVFGRRKGVRRQIKPGDRAYFSTLSPAIGGFLKTKLVAATLSFLLVFLVVSAPFGLLYVQTHESPTLGCNSCHNVSMGTRMGIPPEAYKDRNIVPLLDDSKWMVEHWFYPQVAW